MKRQILTAASFALGGAGVVLVGYLSANPFAFTHPVADLPWQSPVPSRSTIVETRVGASPANTLVLSDVTISASTIRAENSQQRFAALEPCSDWTEVGATFIAPEGATGVRRVRHLCSETTSRTSGSQ